MIDPFLPPQCYGAYGRKLLPHFNRAEAALLDEGVLLAIAHARGGGELGAAWHRGGRCVCVGNGVYVCVCVGGENEGRNGACGMHLTTTAASLATFVENPEM